ncbi:MAG: apolipoprotein N-acyltransferase [Planctomycetota bacterium]
MNDARQHSVSKPWLPFIWAGLLWICGPPVGLWPLCFVAWIPLLLCVGSTLRLRWIWIAATAYWLLSLQGLRHAHPLMFLPWLALSAYLGIYPVVWMGLLRWLTGRESRPWLGSIQQGLVAACLWVGLEWIRNHFATGISVLMAGHALGEVPILVQIADVFGTYGVSFLVIATNAWLLGIGIAPRTANSRRRMLANAFAILLLLSCVMAYGHHRLQEPIAPGRTRFLLLGRDEQTEYAPDLKRDQRIFEAYRDQMVRACASSQETIDAVVWPESMFGGGNIWYSIEENLQVPPEAIGPDGRPLTKEQMQRVLQAEQFLFENRSRSILAECQQKGSGLFNEQESKKRPDPFFSPAMIVGCGVLSYGDRVRQHSGVLSIDQEGRVADWYAKTHLVLFGETVPLVKSVPIIRDMIPPGFGLDHGTQVKTFQVGTSLVLPNLCIETAVERTVMNQMRTLLKRESPLPDVVVSLTNDAWFDHSAVVDHHLRCAQLVAVASRRPILSSANGGPTAWIDSAGRIVTRLDGPTAGEIVAVPDIDPRASFYVRRGAVFAGILGWGTAGLIVLELGQRFRLNRLLRRSPPGTQNVP